MFSLNWSRFDSCLGFPLPGPEWTLERCGPLRDQRSLIGRSETMRKGCRRYDDWIVGVRAGTYHREFRRLTVEMDLGLVSPIFRA